MCRWLVETCSADVNVVTGDGTTPFHYAVWQGHMDVCKWMVFQAGCNFSAMNEFGCNAIQWAVQTGNLEMCRWLSALGLDLTIVNNNGHSALHKAASKGQAYVCEWLLNEECLGLEALQPDSDGSTPGLMARLEGYSSLADALEAAAGVLISEDTDAEHGAISFKMSPRGSEILRERIPCHEDVSDDTSKSGRVLPERHTRETGVGQVLERPPFRMSRELLESCAKRQVVAGSAFQHIGETEMIPRATAPENEVAALERADSRQPKAQRLAPACPSIIKGSAASYQAACIRRVRLQQLKVLCPTPIHHTNCLCEQQQKHIAFV
jgi:hypothetical protein